MVNTNNPSCRRLARTSESPICYPPDSLSPLAVKPIDLRLSHSNLPFILPLSTHSLRLDLLGLAFSKLLLKELKPRIIESRLSIGITSAANGHLRRCHIVLRCRRAAERHDLVRRRSSDHGTLRHLDLNLRRCDLHLRLDDLPTGRYEHLLPVRPRDQGVKLRPLRGNSRRCLSPCDTGRKAHNCHNDVLIHVVLFDSPALLSLKICQDLQGVQPLLVCTDLPKRSDVKNVIAAYKKDAGMRHYPSTSMR